MGAMKSDESRIAPTEAAKQLDMDLVSFQHALRDNRFPISIGMAFIKEGNVNYTYYVFRKPFEQLKKLWGIE